MNYEEMYQNLQPDQKVLKDSLAALQKFYKAVCKETESGDFAEQMLAACEEKGVDVRGEFPVYEMFPYKVKVDAENQDLYLDRKKVIKNLVINEYGLGFFL